MREYRAAGEGLIVRSEAVFQTVLELEMIHRENRHGALRLKAVAGWTDEDLAQECTWQDTQITVLREGEEDAPLFSGTLSCLSFDRSEGVLEIRGLGGSVAMDREKRRRSFQNGKRTYHDIVREVMEGYPEGACIWNAGEDGETGGPLIQYEETDWEFLIRLCSHFGQPLFADLKTGRPQFFFGMGQGQRRSLEESRITGTGFDNSYYHNGCYENGLTREAAFYLDVETTQYWQMGDSVLWQDRIWRVYERRICLMGGALQCAYRLGREGAWCRKKLYNPALRGLRLEGTVRRTAAESVWLQLDMDQREGSDWPWPWAPETNSLCYCMPESGTKAVLYLQSTDEREGRVILAAVENIRRGLYTDSQKRAFVTAWGKQAGLYPDRLFLKGADVSLSMEDARGARLDTGSATLLQAAGSVHLKGSSILITAPLEVVCCTPQSNIEICRDFNFYAQGGVNTYGADSGASGSAVSARGNQKRRKQADHWQASYTALGAIPKALYPETLADPDIMPGVYACGSIPSVAGASAMHALLHVMHGTKESEYPFPHVLKGMEQYIVKGGYALWEE